MECLNSRPAHQLARKFVQLGFITLNPIQLKSLQSIHVLGFISFSFSIWWSIQWSVQIQHRVSSRRPNLIEAPGPYIQDDIIKGKKPYF